MALRRFPAFMGMMACLLLLSTPAAARTPAASAMDEHWQNALTLMEAQSQPVAGKLLTWIYATETELPMEAHALIAFVRENPGWPRLHDFRAKIEESIDASGLSPQETAAWFRENPPQTYDGMRAQAKALAALGLEEEAKQAFRAFWQTAELAKNETASLASVYKKYFTAQDHAARLDALIWAGRYREAEYMLAFVDAHTRKLGQARIGLAEMSRNADSLVAAVPDALKNDEGLLYERARWRRRKNMDSGALEMINATAPTATHAEAWWAERNILARRAMEKLDFKAAAALITPHGLAPGSADYAQAEWLLGWLELRFLDNPQQAYFRFENLYNHVVSAISRSRAAYWAARAAARAGAADFARSWHLKAAAFTSTYYGQMSYTHVHGAPDPKRAREAPLSAQARAAHEQNELVRAVRLLQRVKLEKLSDPFLAKLVSQAKTKDDYRLAAALAVEVGRDYYAVQANKDIQQNIAAFMLADGYPLMDFPMPREPEKALVHAIAYRESMFNTEALSPAGALGLMQLMPATAKSMARRNKIAWSKPKLTAEPRYNIRLGATYLADLVKDYNGYLPYAIAAYNAGPGNVSSWRKTFGDPAAGEIDIVDWVELVPNYETRNYIQRVLETHYMYRLLLGEKPLTIYDFSRRKK